MQTERHCSVGVDGADRRFRCRGRASRRGITTATATFGGHGLSVMTIILLAVSALQLQQTEVDAFSPRSAVGTLNQRRSSVVLSSAYTKESLRKQQDGGQTNIDNKSQLLLDDDPTADEDGIGRQQPLTATATATTDSLLDEEFLSFLTSGDDNVLTAAVGLPEDCANNIVEIDTQELAHIDRNAQKKAVEAVAVEEKASDAVATATRAAAVTAATVTEEEAPSVSKIIQFAIPAIGVWLCGPILSLIDTSAVGLLSGTAQQAALNPAVAISDYTNLLLAFLYTATTNLSASARAADNANIANGSGGDSSPSKTTRTLITALQLSGYVGTAVGAALILSSKFLVTTMLGTDATIDPEVMTAALTYVRIRALGVPAAAVIGAAQSACLGMRDIRSPLYVLAAAAVVNFFGDVLFVGCSHPLLGGAAGAAWATTFSQFAALGMFVKWLRSPGGKNKDDVQVETSEDDDEHPSSLSTINISDAILELTGQYGSKGAGRRAKFRRALQSLRMSSSSADAGSDNDVKPRRSRLFGRRITSASTSDQFGANQNDTFSARGFLENKMRKRDLFQLPPSESAKEFLPYVLPVTTTSIGRVSSYAAMAHVVASSLGTAAMAAQQIVLSLFYCLTPIADSLGLTAQSFVPGIHSQNKDSPHRPEAIRRTTAHFYKAGAIFSAAMVGAVATIPVFSKFFTSDPSVVGMVNSVAPFLAVFFASHGMFSASEGVLLGQKDLGFLGKSYASFFAVVPFLMLQVKRAALSGTRAVDLTSVWGVFVCYQLFRSLMWGLRLLQLQRRVDSDSEAALWA